MDMREYSEAIPNPTFCAWGYHGDTIDGEELVEEPFQRLIDEGKLMPYPHGGYWTCMGTFKEKQDLEDLFGRGSAPWTVRNHQHENNK